MTAKAEVWSDRAGFERLAQDFVAATGRLLELAKGDDLTGFKTQLEVVHRRCDKCHEEHKN